VHAAGGTGAGGPALRSGPRAAQVELVPGGQHRAVAAGNRAEYIMRMANFRLNVQIRAASNAFRAGLEAVVERAWLRMFHESELQARPAPAGGRPRGRSVPREAAVARCREGGQILCVRRD